MQRARHLPRPRRDHRGRRANEVDYMDVSPKQMVSVATAMIPFLENDDANRALMGSNMQRQAVPLLITEAPIVGTGMEYKAAHDSGVVLIAQEDGVVDTRLRQQRSRSRTKTAWNTCISSSKFQRSNQGTCINQRPIVTQGRDRRKGRRHRRRPLAPTRARSRSGSNILVGFMTWEGYNYEDAFLSAKGWSRTTSLPPSTSRSMRSRPATRSSGRRRSPGTSRTSARTR